MFVLAVLWQGFSLIFGSEEVKIEGAGLLVSQVSGATHLAATDTPAACEGEDRNERSDEEKRKDSKGAERESKPC